MSAHDHDDPARLVRFSAAVPADLLEEFDAYTSRRGLGANRSEAIRDLMRERLVREATVSPKEPVVGTITMVYDHHASSLTEQLGELQHHNADLVVSSLHVHLDNDNCMEVVVVHGCGRRVFELADSMLGLRGVKYGELSCAATDSQLHHS